MTLTFQLPEEQIEADLATRGSEYINALTEILTEARRRVKYENASSDLNEFYTWMWKELTDRNIDPFC